MPDNIDLQSLAINGGPPVRSEPMPPREAFGDTEVAALTEVAEYYRSRRMDPPYQGPFEEKFCDAFCTFMGGGYADGVSTGTAACFVGLAALDLPEKSEVIISPATDSGPLNSIFMQGHVPVVADSQPDSYNMGVDQFLERVTPNTNAVLAVHAAGEPLEIDRLTDEAHKRGIKVLEDCSQAPGAICNGARVGSFGDVAAFSTMYRKTLATGGSGGLVFTKDEDTYHLALAHADRGKSIWRKDINLADPSLAPFPALNFNSNEFSSAIGLASLARLQDAIDKRNVFAKKFAERLSAESSVCRPYNFHEGFSPFFFPVFVDLEMVTCTKIEFAEALAAEGIGLNVHFGCVISAWDYAKPYLSDDFQCPNAMSTRDRSFNMFLNECYGEAELDDTIAAIIKIEKYYLKN